MFWFKLVAWAVVSYAIVTLILATLSYASTALQHKSFVGISYLDHLREASKWGILLFKLFRKSDD